jgi:hypothetical protein
MCAENGSFFMENFEKMPAKAEKQINILVAKVSDDTPGDWWDRQVLETADPKDLATVRRFILDNDLPPTELITTFRKRFVDSDSIY